MVRTSIISIIYVVCFFCFCLIVSRFTDSTAFIRKHEIHHEVRVKSSNVSQCSCRQSAVTNGNCSKSLPGCIIIGVSKCGTKALIEYMSIHPGISIVRHPEELHFFDLYYRRGLAWYTEQMPCKMADQIAIEKTPMYFHDSDAPKRIYRMNNNIRLLVIVREPVVRAISEYTMSKAVSWFWNVTETFEESVFNSDGTVNEDSRFLRHSLYAVDLKMWLKFFNLHQIHVVDGDILLTDPETEMKKVERFLGLCHCVTSERFIFNGSNGFPCFTRHGDTDNMHCLGKAKGRPHPTVNPEVIRKLKTYFKPHNHAFYEIVGRTFHWD